MKKVLTSFGFGDQSKLINIAVPYLLKYAQSHNYDLFIPNEDFFSKETKTRHYSWWKIELIKRLFNTYDNVLWVDADVIICDFQKDIFEEMDKDSHVGMVVHKTNIGYVPNYGVWTLNIKCMEWFADLWNYNSLPRSEGFWEQDAMLYKLGIDTGSDDIKLPESYPIPWTQLDYVWNPHVQDYRGIPNKIRFFHATMFENRYKVMKHIASQVPL